MTAQIPVGAKIVLDDDTEKAMVRETGKLLAFETIYKNQLDSIRNAYALSLASASTIFGTKFLDRKAFTSLGSWKSSEENYYYRHIRNMVQNSIIPSTLTIGKKMLKDPITAIYWGPYIYKICEDTKNLCYEFESIVTNSTIGFSDLDFVEVNPKLHSLFRLSQMGGQDWQKVLQSFSITDAMYSKEGIKSALDNLANIAKNIPNTVATNVHESILIGTDFDGNLIDKVESVRQISDNVQSLYNALSTNSAETFLSLVGLDGDISKFLVLSDYNMKDWANDYVREMTGQYYTQRWYIETDPERSIQTYSFVPDVAACPNAPWHRLNIRNGNTSIGPMDDETLRRAAERLYGWSQLKVDELNKADGIYTYKISYELKKASIPATAQRYFYAAYAIYVTQETKSTQVVYSETFDSQTMNMQSFEASMNAKLASYNNNSNGLIYVLKKDEKVYYDAALAKQMTGCEKVVFTVNCTVARDLASGNSYYPCGYAKDELIPHCKECAYSEAAELLDINEEIDERSQPYRQQLEEVEQRIEGYTNNIRFLEEQNTVLEARIREASINDIAIYQEQIAANKEQISLLQELLDKTLAERQELLSGLNQLDQFTSDNDYWYKQANHNRIAGIMADLSTKYSIEWAAKGSWNGYIYKHVGNLPGGLGSVTFTAQLSLFSKPLVIFGIKFRNAKIQIDWTLKGLYNNIYVADILDFDDSVSDQEKADQVNARRSELARECPDCIVDVDYIKSAPVSDDDTEDTYHLLWASDRLNIARRIDAQLTKTYADLVILNKMLGYRFTLQTLKEAAHSQIDFEQGKKKTIVEESLGRWSAAASGKKTSPQ